MTEYAITVTTPSRQSDLPDILDLVESDIQERRRFGMEKYGVPLRPFDLNDPLKEAYQEQLDHIIYLRQAIYERDAMSIDPVVWQLVHRLVVSLAGRDDHDGSLLTEAVDWLVTTGSEDLVNSLGPLANVEVV